MCHCYFLHTKYSLIVAFEGDISPLSSKASPIFMPVNITNVRNVVADLR